VNMRRIAKDRSICGAVYECDAVSLLCSRISSF